MVRAAQFLACVGMLWTIVAVLAFAIMSDPRISPWDRAAMYYVTSQMSGASGLVSALGVAGAMVAILAIRRKHIRQSCGICTAATNALTAVANVSIALLVR